MNEFRSSRLKNASMASFVSSRSLDFISFVTSVTWMFEFEFEFELGLVLGFGFLNVLLVVLVLDDENDEG